jgi:hypothetical protein
MPSAVTTAGRYPTVQLTRAGRGRFRLWDEPALPGLGPKSQPTLCAYFSFFEISFFDLNFKKMVQTFKMHRKLAKTHKIQNKFWVNSYGKIVIENFATSSFSQ